MLPAIFEKDLPRLVVTDTEQRFRVMLLPAHIPDDDSPIFPLWSLGCGDRRSMDAVANWCCVRRGYWGAWAEIAETKGSGALAALIAELMTEAPIGEVQATLVQKGADPRTVNLGELIVSAQGVREQILYCHRFSTPGKRNRFYKWLCSNTTNGSPETLMDLGVSEGTKALAKVLEEIASGRAPDLSIRMAA